jgi:putative RNA 2'-phosphotransferase
MILRHQADDFGIELDEQGFAEVDAVWAQVTKRYQGQFSISDLLKVVEGLDEKKRFELVEGRIRARYGHTAVRTIAYDSVEPPEYLYHGTTQQALKSIRAEGLRPQQRQMVHLSLDPDWAQTVGQRHSKESVVLRVRAGEMHAAGHEFYHPEPKHYLTAAVPVTFIDFADETEA